MRRITAGIAAALVIWICTVSSPPAFCRVSLPSNSPIRVLFIGNSYTYFNNLPRIVEAMSASTRASRKLETRMLAVGGAKLSDHWNEGSALKLIGERKWDYVVLQEQSTLGGNFAANGVPRVNRDPDSFFKYARLFDKSIKQAGAKTIFFLTWAREDAPPSEQSALNVAYTRIGRELGALVAPVGLAWQAAREADSNLKFYIEDKSHPSPSGSYLAACVFYSIIYDKDPSGLISKITGTPIDHDGAPKSGDNGTLVDLSRSDAGLIQRVAWQTVIRTRASGSR